MKIEELIKQKLEESIDILKEFGMPSAQQNERTAYCLLSLLNVTPEKEWKNAENPLVGITPMMTFAKEYYNKEYARPVNSPNAVYQISPKALEVIKAYKTSAFNSLLADFIKNQSTLSAKYAHEREMNMVSVKIKEGHHIQISPGKHSELIRDIIEQMAPRFLPNSTLVYVGDTGEKWGYYDQELAGNLLFKVQQHGKMPDVILYVEDKKWLVLVESVTSHGPVDSKRYIELEELFGNIDADKIYISAFPDKKTFTHYAQEIAWETEAWIANNPTHMIHFNGDKFIGPHNK